MSLVIVSSLAIIIDNMTVVTFPKFLDGSFNVLHSSLFSHLLSRIVAVSSSSVPVSFNGFRVKGHGDAEVFSHPLKDVTGHPEVVTHGDSLTRSNLELPLSWHHLCVGSTDLDSGIHAAFDMSSLNISTINRSGTNSAIVGSLGSRKTILWPTKGMLVIIKQGILLLDPKPGFVLIGLLHDPHVLCV